MTQPKKRTASAAKNAAAAPAPVAPKPTKKTKPKPKQPRKKAAAPRRAAAAAAPGAEPESRSLTDAELAFIEATIARGEAQSAGPDGELPPGATHEIVETPSGPPTVRRKRFSAA